MTTAPVFDPTVAPALGNGAPDPAEVAAQAAAAAAAQPSIADQMAAMQKRVDDLQAARSADSEGYRRLLEQSLNRPAQVVVQGAEEVAKPDPMPDPLLDPDGFRGWTEKLVARGVSAAVTQPASPYGEDAGAILARTWDAFQGAHPELKGREWVVQAVATEINQDMVRRRVDPVAFMQQDPDGYNKRVGAAVAERMKGLGVAEGDKGGQQPPPNRTGGLPPGGPGPAPKGGDGVATGKTMATNLTERRQKLGII